MSETINDGGPAFPGQATKGSSWTDEDGVLNHDFNSGPGMTLRDWYAGHAVIAIIQRFVRLETEFDPLRGMVSQRQAKLAAEAAYRVADALVERSQS
jgi:hypothetical protein